MTRKTVDVDQARDDAFAIADDLPPFASPPHAHAKHQILYAASGSAVLVAAGARWILPPQRAAWIRAHTEHQVTSATGIALRTVYFAPEFAPPLPGACAVFAVTPLAREMLQYAARWGSTGKPGASAEARTREAFFAALAGLCREWVRSDVALVLPNAKTAELVRATSYVATHLGGANVAGAAAAAHVSVRTLSRRFEEELALSFRTYLQTARLMRAMEILSQADASVTRAAYEVGFQSLGAFTTAFRAKCGETPSAYQARVRGANDRAP